MLSLLIVSLVAGLCYGQEQGKYSDCATVQTLTMTCATNHLAYLKTISVPAYTSMQMTGAIDSPSFVLRSVQLDDICNNTMELKKYYKCVFSNVTTCLQAANSTQLRGTPDAETLSMGVVDLCEGKDAMNKTCVMAKITEVEACVSKTIQEKQMSLSNCMMYEEMVTCADKLTMCAGGDLVKKFVVSGRPSACPTDGAGQHYLASALLVVSLLLTRSL